jgi:cation transport regulator ChaC
MWGVSEKECVVESEKKQHYQSDEKQTGATDAHVSPKNDDELSAGITIVRNSTPRPMSLGPFLATLSSGGYMPRDHLLPAQQEETAAIPGFPKKAPSAPPLPEEISEQEEEVSSSEAPAIGTIAGTAARSAMPSTEVPQEFDWLFEYGLEMDNTILNSPERLDGVALLYGPAVLKGYSIQFGIVEVPELRERENSEGESHSKRTLATIVPGSEPGAEVWGVLYRIPRRLRARSGSEPALLDTVHAAGTPQSLFQPVQAVVHETYRDREIECVTYIATEMVKQQMKPLVRTQEGDTFFVQRVTSIGRKLGLPEHYLHGSLLRTTVLNSERDSERLAMINLEQNTEPLAAVNPVSKMPLPVNAELSKKKVGMAGAGPWLVVFAVYLGLKLLVVLTFAVLQGMGFGGTLLDNGLTLLGVPWLVLMYGLLGGCISSIVTLGRLQVINPPIFIIVTWFTRPYIGAALALLSYLFLTSGFFIFTRNMGDHSAFFLLIGALAGLSEGWFFTRQR